jgi:hypothetical protein
MRAVKQLGLESKSSLTSKKNPPPKKPIAMWVMTLSICLLALS